MPTNPLVNLTDRIRVQQIPDPDPQQFERFAQAVARLLIANVLRDAHKGEKDE